MPSTLTIPVHPSNIVLMPASATRQVRTYQEGVAYGERPLATNPSGQALYRFDAVAEMSGRKLGAIVVESTTELEDVPLGALYRPTGSAAVHISTRREAFDLNVTLRCDGVEAAK